MPAFLATSSNRTGAVTEGDGAVFLCTGFDLVCAVAAEMSASIKKSSQRFFRLIAPPGLTPCRPRLSDSSSTPRIFAVPALRLPNPRRLAELARAGNANWDPKDQLQSRSSTLR